MDQKGGNMVVVKSKTDIAVALLQFIGHLQTTIPENKPKEIEAWLFSQEDNGEHKIEYRPSKGKHTIKYMGNQFEVEVFVREDQIVADSFDAIQFWEVRVYCSEGIEPIDKLLLDCYKHAHPKSDVKKTSYYRFTGSGSWRLYGRKIKRSLDTLFLPKGIVEEIKDDLEVFFKEEAEFTRFGKNYKKVYLLVGKPGLGKSTFIATIAGYFNLNIYVYSLDNNSCDSHLVNGVEQLENNSILVLEDIDSYVDKISLTGITNILDGTHTKERMIVFMTTNHPERLESSLIRSGRVDKTIKFDYADEYQISSMIIFYFPSQPLDEKKLEELCKKLAYKQVPCASISDFLFRFRHSTNILQDLEKNLSKITKKAFDHDDSFYEINSFYS